MHPALPVRFSVYRLEEFLGGGMSAVYRARDTEDNRIVVVKILSEQGSQDIAGKARFLLEAQMGADLSHPNIIRILKYGEEHGRPFLVMDYLEGEDLSHAIRDGHTGDLKTKLEISLQIARALEYVHSKKIIHRDIKPENIHVDHSGHVTLMDFGIAKAENLRLTRTGATLGTPYYMSPEQVCGDPVTELADIYAFGIVVYELMCGLKGNTGDTVDKVFYQILHTPLNFEPLKQLNIPQGICALVARCTVKKPLDRIPSFTAICEELERLIRNPKAKVEAVERIQQPQQQYYKPRRRIPFFRILFLLLFVVFPLAYFFGPPTVRSRVDEFVEGPTEIARVIRSTRDKIAGMIHPASGDAKPARSKKRPQKSEE